MLLKKKSKSSQKSSAKKSKVIVGLRSKLPKSKLQNKKAGLVSRAGGKIGGKLPRSKWKLAYLTVLAVFVITLGGTVWLNYYNYNKLTKASAGFAYFDTPQATFKVCKYGPVKTGYGILIPIVVITIRKNTYVQLSYADIYRVWPVDTGGYRGIGTVYGQNQWWYNVANRLSFYVSYNYNDRWSLGVGSATNPIQRYPSDTRQMGLADPPVCDNGT